MNNETTISAKFETKVSGTKKLEKYADTLERVQDILAKAGVSNMDLGGSQTDNKIDNKTKKVSSLNSELKKVSDTTKKLTKNFNIAFNIAKITIFAKAIKNLTKSIISASKKSADYFESLNLLDNAFAKNGKSSKETSKNIEKFINKYSEMYGLDESWLVQTTGLFKQLANAMGLSNDVGEKLSKTLTLLSVDTASLYNLDVSESASAIQSALSGQTKPVRSRFGADITQTTLQSTLDRNGIKKDIQDLSYAEKRLVIIVSLLQQTKQAQGDWANTLNSIANQMRIFEEQISRVTRAIGNLFLPILKKILPYINGFLMAIKELIDMLAKLVGFNEKDFRTDITGKNITNNFDNIGASAKKADEETKKLNRSLRSFDKLNNITTPTSTDKSSGLGGISSDILKLFNKESDKYLDKLDKMKTRADKVKDSIMKWLGFTKQTNKETDEVTYKYSGIETTLNNISNSIDKLDVSKITTKINEAFKKVDWTKILPGITKIKMKLVKKITDIFLGIEWGYILQEFSEALALSIKEFRDGLLNIEWRKIGEKLSTAFVSIRWEKIGKEIVETMFSGINIVVELIGGINWGEVARTLSNTLDTLISTLDTELKKVDWNNVRDTLKTAITNFVTNIDYEKLFNDFLKLLGNAIKVSSQNVFEIGATIWGLILSGLIRAVVDTSPITKIIDKLKNGSKDKDNKKKSEDVGKVTGNSIIDGLLNAIPGVSTVLKIIKKLISGVKDKDNKDKAGEIGKTILKNILNSLVPTGTDLIKVVNSFIDGLNKAFSKKKVELHISSSGTQHGGSGGSLKANGGIFDGKSWKNIPMYANSGLPPTGQIFVANERGPELVGHIGGQTFVANQRQITNMINRNTNSQPVNATIVLQVGSREVAREVISNLQDIAKSSGKPITIS